MSEKDILDRLIIAETTLQEARLKTNNARRMLYDLETDLVAAKITKENLEEELRQYILKYPEEEATLNELDIARFKEMLPGLLEKLKHE